MLDPFSDGPAYRARLAGISRVDIQHGQPGALRLVGHKVLQLTKGPAMQACPDALSGLDAVADMRQVFHADFTGPRTDSFCHDGLADFVIDMLDVSNGALDHMYLTANFKQNSRFFNRKTATSSMSVSFLPALNGEVSRSNI